MVRSEKIVVAMSGGVDSSVAACFLVEDGFDVTGLFMRIGPEAADGHSPRGGRGQGCCSAADAADARFVAGRLNIPFFALNFRDEFDKIIDAFADEYVRGRTPNPCVLCNEQLKFGRLLEYARAIGADGVATGHYARIDTQGDRPRLRRAADRAKDQSYVLFGIPADALARTRFPIGDLTKDDVRQAARRFGLPVHDKPDSADICFVPDRDYARVVRERRPDAFAPGTVRDASGRVVGEHEGVGRFTVGQRRGLRIAMGRPYYVTAIDASNNEITIGPESELLHGGLVADRVRWHIDPPSAPIRARVQIRYHHDAAPATIEPGDGDAVRVRFDEPQRAITPGQAAVFYDGDIVVGGGWIERRLDA